MPESAFISVRLEGKQQYIKNSQNFRKEFKEFSNRVTEDRAGVVVSTILERIRKLLAPKSEGGTQNIGVTGAASRNFVVQLKKPAVGYVTYEITEGSATPANQIIREGMGPIQVSMNTLRRWAMEKGIELYHPLERDPDRRKSDSGVAKIFRFQAGYQRKSKSGKITKVAASYHSRNIREGTDKKFTSKQIATGALAAIRNALAKFGTDREGANWFDKYPKGQGRFNYIGYAFYQHDTMFERAAGMAGEEVARALVEYLDTGGERMRYGFKNYNANRGAHIN
jgi:hypothetical protein